MRWSERQRAMLREMGIRLWLPEDAPHGADASIAGDARASNPAAAARAHAAAADANAVATVVEERPTAVVAERRSDDLRRDPTRRAVADPSPREERRAFARSGEAAREPSRLPGLAAADWLVVGDPLDAGDPQQQQLLENMLRAIGVGLVAPTREQRAVYVALDAGTADASAAQLRAALDVVAPRCVLAFGRGAAGVLLGETTSPLGALRGRVHARAGVPVVVTFALAFLLRHPAEKAKAWADLCLAVRSRAAPAA